MIRREEIIGDCRLILGDCLEALQELEPVGSLISDVPYGIDAKLGMGGGKKGDGGMWKGVRIPGDKDVFARNAALLIAAAPFAVFGKIGTSAPPETRTTVIWDKGEHTGAGDLSLPWKPNFDVVFIGGKGWSHHRRGSGIVKVNAIAGCVGNRNDGQRAHPFEKPIGIMEHFIERAPPGVVLDPFMGSGTTGVACVKLRRPFIGIEVDEGYFETACRRVSDAYKPSHGLFAGRAA